jgi:hypothetical protein
MDPSAWTVLLHCRHIEGTKHVTLLKVSCNSKKTINKDCTQTRTSQFHAHFQLPGHTAGPLQLQRNHELGCHIWVLISKRVTVLVCFVSLSLPHDSSNGQPPLRADPNNQSTNWNRCSLLLETNANRCSWVDRTVLARSWGATLREAQIQIAGIQCGGTARGCGNDGAELDEETRAPRSRNGSSSTVWPCVCGRAAPIPPGAWPPLSAGSASLAPQEHKSTTTAADATRCSSCAECWGGIHKNSNEFWIEQFNFCKAKERFICPYLVQERLQGVCAVLT